MNGIVGGQEDGVDQDDYDRRGGKDGESMPAKADEKAGNGSERKGDDDRWRNHEVVIMVGQPQTNVEQANAAKEAGRRESGMDGWLANELQGDREEADPEEDEVVEVDHQVARLLGLVFVNEVVKLEDIGEKEADDAGKDQQGSEREVVAGKVAGNPDDGFTEHHDDQGG